jgi:hypothetical protein
VYIFLEGLLAHFIFNGSQFSITSLKYFAEPVYSLMGTSFNIDKSLDGIEEQLQRYSSL